MNKKILATVVATFFSSALHANVIIDDFSVDTPIVSSPGSHTSSLGASSDFSDTRELSISHSGPDTASVAALGNMLGVSTGFATEADTTSSYENTLGYDFTSDISTGSIFDAFLLNLVSIDQGGVELTLTVNGVDSSKFVNTVGQVVFEQALFAGVDFSNVTDIDLDIHNNHAVDATFDMFGYYGSELVNVSEPGMPALLMAGLFGLIATRKLRK